MRLLMPTLAVLAATLVAGAAISATAAEGRPVLTLPPEPENGLLTPTSDASSNEGEGEAATGDDSAALPQGATLADSALANPGEAFVHANTAYEAGEYDRAAKLYGELIENGHRDGRLHYNLGNAFLRDGKLGRAIAAYRRSQARRPRDQDVAANLAFARKSAKDALAPPAPSPVLQTLLFWHFGLSRGELLRLTLGANALFWGLAALALFRRRSEVLRWAIGASLLALLAFGGSSAWRALRPDRVAVIVPQEIDSHAGTRADSVVRFKLHAGSEVRLIERRGDWLRIELPDGQQGWIESVHAEIVAL